MSTERDELADEREQLVGTLIQADRKADGHQAFTIWHHMADAILAAGYRKPQQVTTVRELHALPTDTVIRSVFGAVFVKDGGWWAETGTRDKSLSVDLDLPATVLHVGGAE